MSQYSTEPEYILEESEKTLLTEKVQACLNRDFLALVADLEGLSKEVTKLVDSCLGIEGDLHVVVRSLREQS